MSRKIIAFALFATMVFSLFAFSAPVQTNAAWSFDNVTETTHETGPVIVYVHNAKNNDAGLIDFITGTNVTVPDPRKAVVVGKSTESTTLKGPYDNFVATVQSFNANEVVRYNVDFILPGYDPDDATDKKLDFLSFTGMSSASIEKLNTTNAIIPYLTQYRADYSQYSQTDVYGFRYTFTLDEGGNSQTVTLRYKDAYKKDITFSFTIKYEDSTSSGKPIKSLYVNPSPAPYTDGDYNSYIIGNVLFIDVALDIVQNFAKASPSDIDYSDDYKGLSAFDPVIAPMKFTFETVDGDTIPAKNRAAYVIPSADGESTSDKADGSKMFAITQMEDATFEKIYGTDADAWTITNGSGIKLPINLAFSGDAPKTFRIIIEDQNYIYDSGDIDVQYRVVPRNHITNVVIAQGRNIEIEVGETITLEIASAFKTTYTKLLLGDNGQQDNVLIRDMKLTGLKVGSTNVFVYANSFNTQVIDTLTVTVVAAGGTTTTPPTTENDMYRVVVKGSLNIRSGPGTSYTIVGKYVQNDVVEVVSIANGWAQLSNGTYVSAAYLVKVSSSTGNAITTASNLNVRTGPGTSYSSVTKYPYGTSIVVTGYSADGKWAQLDNGYWVSVTYIR